MTSFLSKILDAGKELKELSPEIARCNGHQSAGGNESARDATDRIFVSRGHSNNEEWGPRLSIDRMEVDLNFLSKEDTALLEKKLEKAFKPLFDKLECEKREEPLHRAEEKRLKASAEKDSQEKRAKEAHSLIESLD